MRNVVFNEAQYAQDVVRTSDLGSSPFQALVCVARYFMSLGFDADAIRTRVNALYNRENSYGYKDIADSVIKEAGKRDLADIRFLPITAAELETIQGIDGLRRQRVAFALLVIAKYQNEINPRNHNWVNFRHKDVFAMANVKVSVRDQYLLLNDLKTLGLLKYNRRVDNLDVRVLYADDDGAATGNHVALEIYDMRNLGYQLMRYQGGAFLECKSCGIIAPRKSPRQMFCVECSKLENAKRALTFYRKSMGISP